MSKPPRSSSPSSAASPSRPSEPTPRGDEPQRFFATCPRGLEEALSAEIAALGGKNARVTDGGVAFEGRHALAYTVNLWSRLASRVLWQVGHARYRDQQGVYDAALKIDWPQWFDVRSFIRVNVTAIRSPLASLDFITLKIKDAIVDRFRSATGDRPSIDTARPDVRIHAFLTVDECTFYLDTSGEALFKRGYRRTDDSLRVDAPLRENLAAGLIVLSGWTPASPLLDPFCGSGTIAIEAAMIAADVAPGLNRTFGFERLSWFGANAWAKARDDARRRAEAGRASAIASAGASAGAGAGAVANPGIRGSDIDPRAVEAARANAKAAGVEKLVEFGIADALSIDAPAPSGTIVTNPPYGVRLGATEDLRALYAAFADTLKRRFAGWDAWLLCGELSLMKAIRLSPSKRVPLFNGAIECRLVEYRLVSGSNRRNPAGAATGGGGKIASSNEERNDG